MAATVSGALDVWTSSFQGDSDGLVLLLDEPEGEGGEDSTGSRQRLQLAAGCMFIRKLDPQAATCKLCSQTPSQERPGDEGFYLHPLC